MDKNREQTIIIIVVVLSVLVIIGCIAVFYLVLFGAPRVVGYVAVVPLGPGAATAVSSATPPPSPASATAVTLATSPTSAPSDPKPTSVGRTFITWQHTDESGRCRRARVGRDWLEVSACEGDSVAVYPLPAERQAELLQFSSAYAGF